MTASRWPRTSLKSAELVYAPRGMSGPDRGVRSRVRPGHGEREHRGAGARHHRGGRESAEPVGRSPRRCVSGTTATLQKLKGLGLELPLIMDGVSA